MNSPDKSGSSRPPISSANEITTFMHCTKCINEMPAGQSPRTWTCYEVGFTRIGLQVWCKRHESNVAHIDFEGHKHPANLTTPKGTNAPN